MDRQLNSGLNKYFREHYDEITNCLASGEVFEYDEEFLLDLYAFANDIAEELKVSKNYQEDYVNECMLCFFSKNWITSSLKQGKHSFSTIIGLLFKRRIEQLQKQRKEVLENERDVAYLSLLEKEVLTPSQVYYDDRNEYKNYFKEKIESDEFLMMYFAEQKTLKEIGEEKGMTMEKVRQILAKKMRCIRYEAEKNLRIIKGRKDKMSEVFELNKYIKDNYYLILQCKEKGVPFEWEEEAVIAVYKAAKDCASKLKVPKEKYDDFIQDCAYRFFSYIIYMFDPDKNISIVTYMYTSFNNSYWQKERKKTNKSYKSTISLDKAVDIKNDGDEVFLIDLIEDCSLTQLELLEKEEFYDFLREKLSEDEVLYKFFVEEKNQREIAEEVGFTQSYVSRLIEKKLKKIRQELESEEVSRRR